jgi:hypothetical protein
MNFIEEPGYIGAFTRDTYPGAIPSGARVVKVRSEQGDANSDGAKATVLGSVGAEGVVLYFVEWDERRGFAVAVASWKLERLQ